MNINNQITLEEYIQTYLQIEILLEETYNPTDYFTKTEIESITEWIKNFDTTNLELVLDMIKILKEKSIKTYKYEVKYFCYKKIIQLLYPYFSNNIEDKIKEKYHNTLNKFITEFKQIKCYDELEILYDELNEKLKLITEFKNNPENKNISIQDEKTECIKILNNIYISKIETLDI